MEIGNVKINGRLVLAPMAGVTNLPFRLLCKKYGASLVYTEMININALERNNKATEKLCQTCKEEKPISFQLFGTREEAIKASVEKIENDADIIDFNFGCPAPQILNSGAGAALLKRPEKIGKIISLLTKYTNKPVTAKVRLGYDSNNIKNISKIIQDNGASAIAIHCRTFKQGFSGKADWNAIKDLDLKIPVIGNGDISNESMAKECLKITPMIMIGRAAMNDPRIFERIESPQKHSKEKILLFQEYYNLAEKHDCLDLHNLKQRAQDFTKSIKHSRVIRNEISKINNVELLKKYMQNIV